MSAEIEAHGPWINFCVEPNGESALDGRQRDVSAERI